MDSDTPSSPPQRAPLNSQITPPLTQTNSTSLAQSQLIGASIGGTPSALPLTAFTVPTLSASDWLRLQHLSAVSTALTPLSTNQPTPPMATPNQAKKPRGRPPKEKPPGQPPKDKTTKKKHSIGPSRPNSDSENQSDLKPQDDDQIDQEPNQRSWLIPQSKDGKSDMDLIVEWCSVYENYNAWQTQKQIVICEKVADFLASKNHPNRPGRECLKKIKTLERWFEDTNELRKGTGEGNLTGEKFVSTLSKDVIEGFKLAKKAGGYKKDDNHGSLQERILRKCPWYEELEAVFGDRPSASPLAVRDSLGDLVNTSGSINRSLSEDLLDFNDNSQSPSDGTGSYKDSWDESQPSRSLQRQISMEDDEDQDMPTLPVQKCSKNKQLIRQLTPSGSLANLSSKRGRVNSMASIPEPGNQSSPDTLGIKSIINCISTKEERIESEERAARTQENLTIKLANSMSTMITTNREKELAMKKSIAFEEMNTKRALARSQMIVDLIGKGMDPTAAEQMALRHLPDIDHSHTPNSTSNDS